jgi:hypothetical protein
LKIEKKGSMGRYLLNMLDANEEEGAVQVVRTGDCFKMEGTFLSFYESETLYEIAHLIYLFGYLTIILKSCSTVIQSQIQDWRQVRSFTRAQMTSSEKKINSTERDKLDIGKRLKIKT